MVTWSRVKWDSNMPVRTIEHSNAPDGVYYYTDDNHTWRKEKSSAKQRSPYYIKKKAYMEKTVLVVVDMEAAKRYQETGDPADYEQAMHVKTPEELAAEYEANYRGEPTVEPSNGFGPGGSYSPQPQPQPEPVGFVDGVLQIRVNGLLPSKAGVWYIDPLDASIRIDTKAELEGRGGKATGAIVLGTDKVALNTVAFGTYRDLTVERKTTTIMVQDFESLTTDKGLPLMYQVIQANNRANAFAAYDPAKAVKYGSVVVAKAGQDIEHPPTDEPDQPVNGGNGKSDEPVKVIVAGVGGYLDQIKGWIMAHKAESAMIGVAAVGYYIVAKTGNKGYRRDRKSVV